MAATDHLDAAAGAAAGEGFWTWVSVSFDALVSRLAALLGDERAAVDGGASVKLTEGGVDLDAFVEDVDLDEADVDEGETRVADGRAKVHETRGTVEGTLPGLG